MLAVSNLLACVHACVECVNVSAQVHVHRSGFPMYVSMCVLVCVRVRVCVCVCVCVYIYIPNTCIQAVPGNEHNLRNLLEHSNKGMQHSMTLQDISTRARRRDMFTRVRYV
jgi:hypothetical protein